MNQQEKQTILDAEHLRLLRLGFIIASVADGFFAFFPLIYVFIGIIITAAGLPGPRRPEGPNPAIFGLFFAFMGLFLSVFFGALGLIKFLASRALRDRRSLTLCYIAAGLACLQVPWGAALGVCSFMVLSRESVKELFAQQAQRLAATQIGPPPARPTSSLFEEAESYRH